MLHEKTGFASSCDYPIILNRLTFYVFLFYLVRSYHRHVYIPCYDAKFLFLTYFFFLVSSICLSLSFLSHPILLTYEISVTT